MGLPDVTSAGGELAGRADAPGGVGGDLAGRPDALAGVGGDLAGRPDALAGVGRELVGRADAFGVVGGVLAAGSGCVVVEGPAGIGKSRLLEEAAARARARGTAVVLGRATELDRVAPLSTLLRALTSGDGPLGAGFGDAGFGDAGLGDAGLGGGGFRVIERVGEAVERFTRSRPLAIVLDDVQWADELTCLALRQLVPGLAGSPVVWLLGRRPLPEQEAIDRLIEEGARRVPLSPLGPEEAAELGARLLGAAPGPSVLELVRGSGGNPFLLEEVLTGLRAEGRISVRGGVAEVVAGGVKPAVGVAGRADPVVEAAGGADPVVGAAGGGVELPAGFVAAVERRLRDLSAEARRLLEAASVLRRPFSVHEAAGVLGVPAGALFGRVEEAVGAGALVGEGDRLAFRHDLIREAVYGGLGAPIRTALHREAASVLRAEGRPPAELAEHLRHGARPGDAAAIRELRAAAEEMTAAAPSAAADLMLRALELARPRDTEHSTAPLVAGAVRLLASAGRLGEARELADGLGVPLTAAEEAQVALGLAEALKHLGDDRGVIRRTGRVLGRSGVPGRERARLLAVRAHALMMTGEVDAAAEAAAGAVAEGEVFAQVVGLQARSTVALFRGDLDGALRHAERSVELADAAGGEAAHRHPRLWLGAAMVALDRFEEAESLYAVVEREAGRLGTAWALPLLHRFRSELLLARGRLDDAAAEAEAGLRVAGQLSAMALAPALLGVLGHVALLRDETQAAREYLDRGRELAGDGPGLVAEELRWRRELLDEATAPGGAPRQGPPFGWATGPGGAPQEGPSFGGALAYLIVQEPWTAARWRRDPRVVACARDLARRNPGVTSLAAGLAHAEGRLEEAVELYRNAPRPLGLAAALEDAGRREEALEVYRSCGAAAGRARREVTGQGWAALTASELRVVRLVARGMTNREAAAALFLSPHTIDSHLRHAFAKLGVNSRVELTRQVLAHEPGR
ncbi:helix-turn-helix transcriptional regulator [Nonomuraea jabiensis]|uniref:DNA-binding CsgD family transcriptional regulator n=1 Tax=Nonomuraea jabiensis TaxID=882448 RepID=A0A7W9GBV4_9ACTN|nr:LuxR family transcriptional regulator [Nonomuraea jabiensis]MBB5780917.1 DNA-binding CsgD family transcriptional regulator [Nonomuraea jabiensis]